MTKETDIIAREGYLIITVSLILAIGLYFLHPIAGIAGTLWLLFCLYFFRNPKRTCEQNPGELIAPADGKVIFVGKADEKHFLKNSMKRVTIFMSPFNVHVNRAPASGKVINTVHCNGKFLAAFSERASDENERSAVHLKTDDGDEVVFVQIAGWFARRIKNYAKIGDELIRGRIFGVIKYGSRMDVYFADHYDISVRLNQKVRAGETIIAIKSKGE